MINDQATARRCDAGSPGPERRPRDALLRDLERRWREADPQHFRLTFTSTRDGRDIFISERAVTMLDAFRLPHWDSNNYGVVVWDTWLAVENVRVPISAIAGWRGARRRRR